MRILSLFLVLAICLISSCSSPEDNSKQFFELMPAKATGIHFVNEVKNTEDFNIFSYRNFYNGGGVALGDINNDGLTDIYLTHNTAPNKLFLNKGNFQFEDISEKAGVGGTRGWSTGVVMIDLNNDGLLDIYVCNAGYVKGDDQQNELFINNGDLTFSEQSAAYQLDEKGYTTHAAFFDYDLDGDLDVYILNNSFIPVNTLNYQNKRALQAKDWPVKDFLKGGGDKLLRNDEGKFTDVTQAAGIYSSLIGFGLGITVGDVNNDELPDMYVSNDFFERDYLYLNQGDGTFKEDIKNWMGHLSLASMGADMADINNDGYPEIFATEMLPAEDDRRKNITLFESYNTYRLKLDRDFYHQYMHNTLQYNNKDQSFSEISWYSGVAASDWSWGALIFDADNDGYRDIYVCNGVYQDVTDQDFMDFFANELIQKMALTGKKEDMQKVIDRMPSNPQANKFFKNNKDLTFADAGLDFGFDKTSFSNGAAYGDLDNDGDLDLVVNNLMQELFVYRNNSNQLLDNHYLSIALKGSPQNTKAIGAKVSVYTDNQQLFFQNIPSRGFQSSIDYKMVFGLGQATKIDSIVVIWPQQERSVHHSAFVDTLITIDFQQLANPTFASNKSMASASKSLFNEVSIDFEAHQEDDYVDFNQEGLVIRKLSREGPCAASGDVNGDGLNDLFVGGASRQVGQLYLQSANGYEKVESAGFGREAGQEDTAAAFFDADNDGDQDLYVGAGGNHQQAGSRMMQDRLYFNNGKGQYDTKPGAIPNNGHNTSVVLPFDLEGDGDMDLFVGSRSVPGMYGVPGPSYIFENNGKGRFRDATQLAATGFEDLGMVTDATFADVNGDGNNELVVTQEWGSTALFTISEGKLAPLKSNINDYSGWWYAVKAADVDGDGDQDLVLGNRGENFYFTGSAEAPAKLWLWDFDGNRTIEKIITRSINGKDVPVAVKKELTEQIVSLKKKNLKHADYSKKSIQELFPPEQLAKALMREGNWFKSAIALNDGTGQFSMMPLPKEVQFSCVCDIYCTDLNGDQQVDLILGGNDYGFTPQFSRQDASQGHVLINKGHGNFERIENQIAGFAIDGEIRQFLALSLNNKKHILATINDQKPRLFEINE